MNSTGFSKGGQLNNANQSQGQGFNKSQMGGFNNEQTLTLANQQATGSNPASLKGKLQNIDELVKMISDELQMHKKELAILRSEKDTLEGVLSMKTADIKKSLSNELIRLEDEVKRHNQHQFAENQRIQIMINTLRQEKTSIQQNLIAMQRRISELELQIGKLEQ